jgi:hypothetical protein
MKILLIPTNDRLGQASIIEHYWKLGHEVFIPKFGSFSSLGLDWSKITQWPSLLCNDPIGQRNLEKHGLTTENCFGEDFFLTQEEIACSADSPVVSILDEDELKSINFDAYHTLRGGDDKLYLYKKILNYIGSPHAKWITSSMSAWDQCPQLKPVNVARILPAPYENYDYSCNTFNMFCLDTEFKLLDINRDYARKNEVASFNHNFHVRQHQDFELFNRMNFILKSEGYSEVLNYGGNTRGMGADIRHSKDTNPVNPYKTLSPKENIIKYKSLKAVVHFKQTDWGGGVFFHALHTETPIITTRRYVNASCSGKYLVDGYNCLLVDNEVEAANAVMVLLSNEKIQTRLSFGMKDLKDKIFDSVYWSSWESFLRNLA